MLQNIPRIRDIDSGNFFLLAGPCVVESAEMTRSIAARIKEITTRLQIPFVFKASYRKANRTSGSSFTGIGDEKSLRILSGIREEFDPSFKEKLLLYKHLGVAVLAV